MQALPEIIGRAMRERSARPPLTSRIDPDFGRVWLVWMDDVDPNSEPDDYSELTEWLGVIDAPGYPQTLMSIEWVDHGEEDYEEFRRLYESLPVEVSLRTRGLFKHALTNLDQVFNNVRTKLKTSGVNDWNGALNFGGGFIVKDELYVVVFGQSFTVDCFVHENLDVNLSLLIPSS